MKEEVLVGQSNLMDTTAAATALILFHSKLFYIQLVVFSQYLFHVKFFVTCLVGSKQDLCTRTHMH